MRKSVCVVGAGSSGLATVRALTLAGHEVHCHEAGPAIGGGWRYENANGVSAAYASLHTNISRRNMHYPSFPAAGPGGERLHHSELLAYLEDYAHANDLLQHVELGSRVERAAPQDDGWLVQVAGGQPRRFDALVAATGHFWDPHLPELPGEFSGEIAHVRDYRTPDAYAGRRVLVVGAGQSALDVAAEISFAAERTLLACREGHHLLPQRVLGVPFDHLDVAAQLYLPWPVARSLLQALFALTRAAPRRGALPKPRHALLEHCWPALETANIRRALAERTFTVMPGLARVDGQDAIFTDGSREIVDAIVFATGYRIDFPFLPERLGRGTGAQFPLYRRILSPHVDGLGFVGIFDAGGGRLQIVEQQAAWLAEVLAGRVELPARGEMWAAIDAGGEPRSRRRFGSAGPHSFLCDRHAYLRTLRRDLRAR